MTTTYDDAVGALYRAPHDDFVTERKRLAKELAAAGDKSGSALLAKLTRPSVSAWATNQLYFRERAAFDELFASAERLREGDLAAGAEHRKSTAKLVARAAEILKEAGHGASESTLRRVSANLAALAAAGGFDPDEPGALKHDRDPPGFDALAFGAGFADSGGGQPDEPARPAKDGAKPRGPAHQPATGAKHGRNATTRAAGARHHEHDGASHASDDAEREAKTRARAEEARAKAEAAAERRRVAEEQARVRLERRKLESALRAVKSDVERNTAERDRLRSELATVEAALERSVTSEREVAARLAELPAEDG